MSLPLEKLYLLLLPWSLTSAEAVPDCRLQPLAVSPPNPLGISIGRGRPALRKRLEAFAELLSSQVFELSWTFEVTFERVHDIGELVRRRRVVCSRFNLLLCFETWLKAQYMRCGFHFFPQGLIHLTYGAGYVVCGKPARKSCRSPRRAAITNGTHLGCPIFEQCPGCTLDFSLERPPLAQQAAHFMAEKHPQAHFELQPCQQVTGEASQPQVAISFQLR